MPADAWRLPERLTLSTVAALHREGLARATGIAAFDVSGVREWDSAGVALIQSLRAEQRRLNAAVAGVIGDTGRYRALCEAHRLADTGLPA
jgi:ABC-type transporter Mla MlaB component